MLKLVQYLSLILSISFTCGASAGDGIHRIPVTPSVCYKIDSNMFTRVLPDQSFIQKSTNKGVQFIGNFNNVTTEAQIAIEYAFSLWSLYLNSDIPINVNITPAQAGESILASASPTTFTKDFEGSVPNIYYPIALAEKIARKELNNPDEYEIDIVFSNDQDLWYFGTDGNVPPNKYDFVSVILHEIGHGLGFIGSMEITNNLGSWGFTSRTPTIYDLYVQNGSMQQLVDESVFVNPSLTLKSEYTSNSLFYNSTISLFKNPEYGYPRLFAPATFDPGSSIVHLNDATYPSGNENSLMTHAIGQSEAIHVPGPLAVNMLQDMGWVSTFIEHEPNKDIEDISQAVKFIAKVRSDNPPSNPLNYVYYKSDSEMIYDSILMQYNAGSDEFVAELFLDDTGKYINYFIKVYDDYGKPYTSPLKAPENIYTFYAGFDNEKPEVFHDPIPFMVEGNDSLEVKATVTDNVGVDTVIVYYNINFSADTFSFGMQGFENDVFKGYFNFKDKGLNLNDIIQYRFFVRDKSYNKNTVLVQNDLFIFEVEQSSNMKSNYVQDFNFYTSDFYGVKKTVDPVNDLNFTISRPDGFYTGCLHTPIPYESPGVPNGYYEYIAQLRFPILLNKSSYMRFDEIALIEPGLKSTIFGDEDFYDYVIVEASKDSGKTWHYLQPGYDARKHTLWISRFRSEFDGINSTAKATPELYSSNYINIINNPNFKAGDVVFFRFRVFSDANAVGWGWAIDNLDIQSVVDVEPLPFDNSAITLYPNPVDDILKLNIQFEKPVDDISISLNDIYGRVHYTYKADNYVENIFQEISMVNLPRGIYFLVLDAVKEQKVRKIIKK